MNTLQSQLPASLVLPDVRLLMEVDTDPRVPATLFLHGESLLNGGVSDGWTLERFERLLQFQTPFGATSSSLHDTRVVVASAGVPDMDNHFRPSLDTCLPTAELYTDVFDDAVSQFAAKHNLFVVVKVHTTFLTLDPEDEDGSEDDFGSLDKRYFGDRENTEARTVVLEFFTRERYDLKGYNAYWAEVLSTMSLNWGSYHSPLQRHDINRRCSYSDEERHAFLQQFGEIPESLLGNPDRCWRGDVFSPSKYVTVIRHRFEEDPDQESADADEPKLIEVIKARTFHVEDMHEQARRHRGGR